MNCNHSTLRALLIAAATLLATGAWAQNPNAASHGKANAADKVEKAADKAEKAADKAEKAADKADKATKDGKDAVDPSKSKTADDRAARKAKEHDAQREKLAATWKGPVSDALRQELRRHAERLARLERIKAVADAEKDKESAEKATKLVAKENERHDKWMNKNVPVLGVTPATVPAAAATDGKKEGAK
jgi:hypothetical protein